MTDITHGTPAGYDAGCTRRAGCDNADDPELMTCPEAKQRYRGDWAYRRAVDNGTATAEYEHFATARAKKPAATTPTTPKPAPRPRVEVAPLAPEAAAAWDTIEQVTPLSFRGLPITLIEYDGVTAPALAEAVEAAAPPADRTCRHCGNSEMRIRAVKLLCTGSSRHSFIAPDARRNPGPKPTSVHGERAGYYRFDCRTDEQCPNYGVDGAITCAEASRAANREISERRNQRHRLVVAVCTTCSTRFGLEMTLRNKADRRGATIYCPAGHENSTDASRPAPGALVATFDFRFPKTAK